MYLIHLIGWLLIPYWLSVSGNLLQNQNFYFLSTEHSMSNRVPETRPLSRCSESSRINVSSNGEDMAPETVSSSLSASLSLSSLTLQTLSCCFHLWRPAQRHIFSLFWLVESAASLHLHRDSTELKRGCWHHFRILWKLKAVEHQQRINTSCLCVFQYYCLIVFFNDFVHFCQWSKSLLVFFSKTSTVSQWKPLCLVGILFVWCNIHPSRIWLVGWSVAFVSVRRQRKALC